MCLLLYIPKYDAFKKQAQYTIKQKRFEATLHRQGI